MRIGMLVRVAAIAALSSATVLIAACATDAGATADPALVAQGEEIARTRCGECHAVGASGASPHPGAPPLRTVFDRTYQSRLAEQLRLGLPVHSAMPAFEFTDDEVSALMAYLKDIEE